MRLKIYAYVILSSLFYQWIDSILLLSSRLSSNLDRKLFTQGKVARLLQRQGLSWNLLSKLVMSLILEKHFVVLEKFPATLKVFEYLWNCLLLNYFEHSRIIFNIQASKLNNVILRSNVYNAHATLYLLYVIWAHFGGEHGGGVPPTFFDGGT